MAINRVVLVGRLTRDPEQRSTASGVGVATFTLAVDDRPRKDGSTQTSFIPCQAWNKTAENVSKYCHKGSLVAIDGRINQHSYLAKDGSKKSMIEVVCDTVQFLESKKNGGMDNGYDNSASETSKAADAPIEGIGDSDDDLPF